MCHLVGGNRPMHVQGKAGPVPELPAYSTRTTERAHLFSSSIVAVAGPGVYQRTSSAKRCAWRRDQPSDQYSSTDIRQWFGGRPMSVRSAALLAPWQLSALVRSGTLAVAGYHSCTQRVGQLSELLRRAVVVQEYSRGRHTRCEDFAMVRRSDRFHW